ncbi:transporter substrate-binding domain-containing protein [Legionella israelensis]|uniref:Glutamine ABC transporter n=1 Tax=Legionella israelensis TaxID=454 RepID=A0A0W0W660_9GAMM|nr:transporter substrate-binding domain-containing protein [Legionella israelensis]KTD27817.1 glutamine ABC transporter [Legionella israelensis]QBS10268.1 transporter substrate-binding domain-containing protein [Legionella israelensis]SCY50714.1 amino acid ABC transporter substrate-binding protein, PAAT family [Legionella israelensis DSM 19235]STX59865.1 glutamine ABC transporter [Legionella israelensis]
MKRFMFIILFLGSLYAYGKTLTVGVPTYAPPFVSTSGHGNIYFGFSIDLMNAICKDIQIKCKYKGENFHELYSLLNNEEIDILLAPTPIAPLNNSNYIFSLPYLESNARFVTLQSNTHINTIMDLKGKKVGALKYTLYGKLLEDDFENLYILIQFSKITDMASALANKKIDGVILNADVAKYLISSSTIGLKFVGDEIPAGEGFGIMSLKKNAPLIQQINDALLKMEEDGTYLNIYNTYFGN